MSGAVCASHGRSRPTQNSGFLLCFFGLACFCCCCCVVFVCLFSYLMFLCGCLVVKSYPTPFDPMDCSTPGFPALHYLPELAQTHVH